VLPTRFSKLVGVPLPRTPRAVLFDVYGTLFSSASGDISSSMDATSPRAFRAAIQSAGIADVDLAQAARMQTAFFAEIRREHELLQERGHPDASVDGPLPFPEVDIREIWSRALRVVPSLPELPSRAVERLALTHEILTNPVGPFPDTRSTIDALCSQDVRLGIVSNAQFYTPLLFEAHFGASADSLGFRSDLLVFSYRERMAKPDPRVFHRPLRKLATEGVVPEEIVYVGNDMKNDVSTAAECGCMTVLFAGDNRSLRLREEQQLDALPHSVILSLSDLSGLLRSGTDQTRKESS
jgi:putative hydrolase of the HAD superfamily